MVFCNGHVFSFNENKMEYYIEWDDKDPSGRDVKIEHLAINTPPAKDEIGLSDSCSLPSSIRRDVWEHFISTISQAYYFLDEI